MTDDPQRLFVHVEEPSMAEAMQVLLPRLVPRCRTDWKIIDHRSKQALLRDLPLRMSGYARWPTANVRVLVLIDRDADDCVALKAQLEAAAKRSGLHTKSSPDAQGSFSVVNRVVIEELEAWFLGDVEALTAAFPGVPKSLGQQARYRNPDAVLGGTWEALLHVLTKAGYYADVGRLPKIDVARRIAPLMSVSANRSRSFQAFTSGLASLVST